MNEKDDESNGETEDFLSAADDVTESDLKIRAADIQSMVVAPTDWTVGVLIDLLKRRKIDLQPNYQRRVAWNESKMSRFIESLFLRLPVPQIVLAEMQPGRFAVIDGKQRMNSLARFCLDLENPLRLENCEYRPDLDKLTFGDIKDNTTLEESLDAFESHTVRTIVIKNWKTDKLLYLLFLRLNQNSVTLSPQELRRALFPGQFMNWLDDKTASSEAMKIIFSKIPDFRMRDMEVATRHLAFKHFAEHYAGNMKDFLDEASKEFTINWNQYEKILEIDWLEYELSVIFIEEIFGADALKARVNDRYQKSKNRAVMDIMTYYFSSPQLREEASKIPGEIKSGFETLCQRNQEFLKSLQTSTKTVRSTSRRFHDWGDTLKPIFGEAVREFPLPRNAND